MASIMVPIDICQRLREHSGLPGTPQLSGGAVFFDIVFAFEKDGTVAGLDEAVVDVVDCLERLNKYYQSVPEGHNRSLQAEVVYAISHMLLFALQVSLELSNAGRDSRKLLKAIWQISCVWDAVLAGDIEDIQELLLLESAARSFG
ncbi:MAG TPA: hypothetical protein VGI40_09950 [Pirellulaceae bacterium]|jgi:hypothetical protein